MIDASIALGVKPVQIENPLNALSKVLSIRQQQGEFDQQQRQYAQQERELENQNKLRDYFSQNDPKSPEFVRGLYGVNPAQAMAFEKNQLETKKGQTEIDAKAFDLATKREQGYKSTLAALHDRPDLSKPLAIAAMQFKLNDGLITPQMFEHVISDLPDDPNALREQLRQGLKEQLSPEQKLKLFAPEPLEQNDGQIKRMVDNNPLSPTYGKPTGAPELQLRASPEAILTDQRTRNEGALNRGVQISGQNLVDGRAKEANRIAGEGQLSSGGPVLGAPVPAVLPWANQSNPKDANKVKANEQTRGAKEIEKDLDAARKERDAASAAKRFLELNKGTNTGALVDRLGVTRWAQGMGSDYSEMESITAKLAPAMREPGSGSTSDFDGKQFERATVGVDKPGTTNQNIAKGVIARAQQAEEYADFRQTYLEQNGTLQGADRFWKDYANKNPIFDPKKEGTFELNQSRKTWKDHFKAVKPAAATTSAGLSAEEAAELAELRKRLGK